MAVSVGPAQEDLASDAGSHRNRVSAWNRRRVIGLSLGKLDEMEAMAEAAAHRQDFRLANRIDRFLGGPLPAFDAFDGADDLDPLDALDVPAMVGMLADLVEAGREDARGQGDAARLEAARGQLQDLLFHPGT